jgi:hypothetical protein
MSKTKTKAAPSGTPTAATSFVLFGADEYGKPRAAHFTGNRDALATAAAAMNLRMFEVTKGDDLAGISKQLPAGRLHASGQAFVPFIKGALYAELVGVTVGEQQPPPASAPPTKLPGTWDEIAPGHLVIVHESFEVGWWPAIVVERKGDMLTLRYRDFPKYPPLVRHRSAIALISQPAS